MNEEDVFSSLHSTPPGLELMFIRERYRGEKDLAPSLKT